MTFDDLITVPRDVLQRVYDALEQCEGRWDHEAEIYVLAEQIDVFMHPDKAFSTVDPMPTMRP